MAAPGQNVNQTLRVAQTPEEVSQSVIAAVSGTPGYTVTMAGSGSIVLTRRFTPTWAIVVAVLGVLFFLIGLLALLVKNTETVTLTLVPEPGGSHVTVSGVATGEMITRLTATFASMPALDAETTQVIDSEGADTKVCPECGEAVKQAAVICRFCRHSFADQASTPSG